jgi:hypothetical protein
MKDFYSFQSITSFILCFIYLIDNILSLTLKTCLLTYMFFTDGHEDEDSDLKTDDDQGRLRRSEK